jgi:hypothetical protein
MPLPPFNSQGDLPEGVYQASLDEVIARFGYGAPQRQLVTARLKRIYALAQSTGKLERFVVFGSYVTAKSSPNDVDIILVMRDDFDPRDYDPQTAVVFDHMRTNRELGASIFWTLSSGMILETQDEFVAGWQVKRDQTLRGIVEVVEVQTI